MDFGERPIESLELGVREAQEHKEELRLHSDGCSSAVQRIEMRSPACAKIISFPWRSGPERGDRGGFALLRPVGLEGGAIDRPRADFRP